MCENKNNKSNLIKIDLDLQSIKECKILLQERLKYLNKTKFLNLNKINKIELIKKKTYGCVITLNTKISYELIFYLQLLLGSDYKKECCSIINHKRLKINYCNRLFSIKKYVGGEILFSRVIDITDKVLNEIKQENKKTQEEIKNEKNT